MANSSARLMAGSNGSARVSLGPAGSAALQDDHWYMVGRLLGPKLGFLALKVPPLPSGFDSKADQNRALHGGPWFYRNAMLMLGDYDGVGSVEAVPLWSLETWVAIKGLPVASPLQQGCPNPNCSTIGQVIRFDQTALRCKEEEQRIRLTLDTCRRVRTWMLFEFSSTIEPEITLIYEKVKGFCRDCGLFDHDAMGCDGFLVKEKEELLRRPLAATMAGMSLEVGRTDSGSGSALGDILMQKDGTDAGMELVVSSELVGMQVNAELQCGLHGVVDAHASLHDVGLAPSMNSSVPNCAEQFLAGLSEVNCFKNWASMVPSKPVPKMIPLQHVPVTKKTEKKMAMGLQVSDLVHVGARNVDENATLMLQHKNGKIIVSPKKKKLGRPHGSKNKPKSARVFGMDEQVKKPQKWKSHVDNAGEVGVAEIAIDTEISEVDGVEKERVMERESPPLISNVI
ncbi:hypothetical protein ABKV19_018876 [Rosa sericea]